MSALERGSIHVLLPLVLAIALAPQAAAQPIHCDNFESGVPCNWTIGSSCSVAICSTGGTCVDDFCDCTPAGDFAFLHGTWTGTWEDTIYDVSGALEATFAVNGSNVTASGVIGLQEFALGDKSGSGSGTISGPTLSFTFTSDAFGSGSGTLDAGGCGSGTGTVTGTLEFGAFTFAGSANPTTISGTFDFTSPSGGKGVASLTKQ